MPRAARTCNSCPAVITTGSKCADCLGKLNRQERATPDARRRDRARGTASDRGYTSRGHLRFRSAVLARDPICVLCRRQWANVADHYPKSRRELVAEGLDPNDPARGRGLCKGCHDRETAEHQPGGWAAKVRKLRTPGG